MFSYLTKLSYLHQKKIQNLEKLRKIFINFTFNNLNGILENSNPFAPEWLLSNPAKYREIIYISRQKFAGELKITQNLVKIVSYLTQRRERKKNYKTCTYFHIKKWLSILQNSNSFENISNTCCTIPCHLYALQMKYGIISINLFAL